MLHGVYSGCFFEVPPFKFLLKYSNKSFFCSGLSLPMVVLLILSPFHFSGQKLGLEISVGLSVRRLGGRNENGSAIFTAESGADQKLTRS